MLTEDLKKDNKSQSVPPRFLNIEGQEIPWDKPTITTEEIARLGGWDPAQGVIMVDHENNERTLEPGEVIEVKPGQGFGKRIRWKRGLVRDRISQELTLLRKFYSDDVVYVEQGDWFLIPAYPMPNLCQPSIAPVCFSLKPGYPGIEPYGFFVCGSVRYNGLPFAAGNPPAPPPFPGSWVFISWSPEGWAATSDVLSGANLWGWARSFAARLKEGA